MLDNHQKEEHALKCMIAGRTEKVTWQHCKSATFREGCVQCGSEMYIYKQQTIKRIMSELDWLCREGDRIRFQTDVENNLHSAKFCGKPT